MSLKIKSDTKFLLNKIVSQFSKSGYDERWANLEITVRDNKLYLIGGGLGMIVVIKVDTEGTASDFAGQVDLRRFFETIKFMGKDTEITFGNNLTVEKKGRKVVFSVTRLPAEPPRAFIRASASGRLKASSRPVITNSLPARGSSSGLDASFLGKTSASFNFLIICLFSSCPKKAIILSAILGPMVGVDINMSYPQGKDDSG